ncbi:hypothetical protein EYV94_28500 [Puteibacter caeruleilacunae]|nr:hypothetical protein EYV94_28500 [Puteibacter caeruleilacunae]
MDGTQGDKTLAITARTHFAALQSLFSLIIILAILLHLLNYDKWMIVAFSIVITLDAISSLYLHFLYFAKNKGEEYEICETKLIRRKNGEKKVYMNNEIEKIIVYLSPALSKNSYMHMAAIENYHYAVVKLKTGEELILTCLLAPRIDKALKKMRGVLFEKRKRLFCSTLR